MASLFTDKVKIFVKSGDGGDGMNSFKSFKGFANGGPGRRRRRQGRRRVRRRRQGQERPRRVPLRLPLQGGRRRAGAAPTTASARGARTWSSPCPSAPSCATRRRQAAVRRVRRRRKAPHRPRRQGGQGQRALHHLPPPRAALRAEGAEDAAARPYPRAESHRGRGHHRLPQRGQEHAFIQDQRGKAQDRGVSLHHPLAQPRRSCAGTTSPSSRRISPD